jgi:cytochrome c-type biogenesis protein CcmE
MEHAARPQARRARGRKVPWGFVVAGVAIVAAIIYLVTANTGASAEYYMTIGELRSCTSCSAHAVRVAGTVAPNTVVRDDKTQVIRFSMADSGQMMPVVYSGVVPDIFRPGIQVVVEGHLVNGVFQAQNLLAKCPSKFQSATPPASGN